MLPIEINRIDCSNQLFCLYIVVVLVLVGSCYLDIGVVALGLEVFFEAFELEGLVVAHFLADQHGDVHLWVDCHHDLLLHCPECQCPTPDVLVREVYLNLPIELLYIPVILHHLNSTHLLTPKLLHYLLHYRLASTTILM